MSKELTYRKLASVSFADVNNESGHEVTQQMNNGGRQYAAIHRHSDMMPSSLKMADAIKSVGAPGTSLETFIIPKMRQ